MARGFGLSPAALRQRLGLGRAKAPAKPREGEAKAPSTTTRQPTRQPKRQNRRWQKIQAEQLRREPSCRLCRAEGKQTQALEVNHILALADGGSFDDPGNLQSLCRGCHWQKTETENAKRAGRKPRRVVRIKGCDPLTGRPLDPNHWWNSGN
jgi:5-methylcytosine-specific restriction protein A